MSKHEPFEFSQAEESPAEGQGARVSPGEIIIGTLVDINVEGQPEVTYPGMPTSRPLRAMATLALSKSHIDRQVALLFANGDPHQPVIMGLIHSPLHDMLESYGKAQPGQDSGLELETNLKDEDLQIDGQRIVFEGKEEIVLKCGEASITLTKAGKILIRGKYLLNRSSGVNRIMGGSVQVN